MSQASDSSSEPQPRRVEIKEKTSVRGIITPWSHKNPVGLALSAGRVGTYVEESTLSPGMAFVQFEFPHHIVMALVPQEVMSRG